MTPVTDALPVRVWVLGAVGVPVTAVGRFEIVTPAFLQMDSDAAASLAMSPSEHFPGTQAFTEVVIFWRPVVHWHVMSVSEHPEDWAAVAKQGRAQVGIPEKSWAETKASEAAKAKMETANFMIADVEECMGECRL